MSFVSRLARESTLLAVIDMQEAFRAVMPDFGTIAARIATVVEGSQLLGVPVLVTEQNPRALKRTAPEIAARLPAESKPIEKSCFSCCGSAEFLSPIVNAGIKHVLVCGIEAHICVAQTALDLLARGVQVFVLADCTTSRDPNNARVALDRLTQAGAVPATVEMALFELMSTAECPQFREIRNLIK